MKIFDPIIIIVKPQLGENIGAIARVMGNFNLNKLRIVSPRDGWPNKKALSVSSGANSILESAEIFENFKDSCLDLNYTFATTIRKRNLTKKIFTPEDAVKESVEKIKSGQKIGFIFGPENFGLSNEIVGFSNSVVSIPVTEKFSSINLSQSVGIILYEWFKNFKNVKSKTQLKKHSNQAKKEDIIFLFEFLKKELEKRKYFWPEDKKNSIELNLQNLFGNLSLTDKDINTLYGVFKILLKK